jgi:hypothetical protein
VFTSTLALNNATVIYTFTSFATATNITLGTSARTQHHPRSERQAVGTDCVIARAGYNQTREITPQYIKFSLWLSHWNWTSTYTPPPSRHVTLLCAVR